MEESLRCKYTYKPCLNPRTTKKNGDLHMLCDYHRDKANEVQKTHAKKRKMRRALENASPQLAPTSLTMDAIELAYLEAILNAHEAPSTTATSSTSTTHLTDEEYAILFELF
ncbi:hypothetical protein SPRG_13594 [Saprolegnia parasitica CBS 223.65]|uniref:Uncharacterized protein n=1 Tax=Saprolegnia parasitica (strain CBS 223.65) TaxID=695850 RepID=A0A067BWT0_SAPPC|nr:hypothetical protein SPRG_13594 [Saprolegnia parasitica CBS 223.65]KDO21295.1 hypothetical protein SPRG_13594 [Saprolegnia parasitica CBS 223.65]|eukprot:XP_012208037.1 hypothetical protein SPRG_13594 [Saprolegnia parasitica CBS 223.65]